MDFELEPEHIQIRETVRKFCQKEVTPFVEKWENEQFYPREVIRKMGEQGFYAAAFPEKYGGTNLGRLAHTIVVEELAKASLGVSGSVNGQSGTCPMSILLNGNEAQIEKYVPGLISAKMIGCFALTEPNVGTDVAGIQTTAIRKGDYYILNGSKTWITNATVFDAGICLAKTDPTKRHEGLSAFILEKDMPGLTTRKIHSKIGNRSANAGEFFFDNCKVPKENLIGEEGKGFEIAESSLVYGRTNVAAMCLGLCDAAVEEAIKYAQTREQFGRPIGNFQMIKQIIADMVASTEAARLLVYRAAWLLDQDVPPPVHEVTIAKLVASETALQAAIGAARVHGAYGYSTEYPAARLYQDALMPVTGEGTSNIQRIIIANHVLGIAKRRHRK